MDLVKSAVMPSRTAQARDHMRAGKAVKESEMHDFLLQSEIFMHDDDCRLLSFLGSVDGSINLDDGNTGANAEGNEDAGNEGTDITVSVTFLPLKVGIIFGKCPPW